jgi:quercetin dioxygenase-like cupin family protein
MSDMGMKEHVMRMKTSGLIVSNKTLGSVTMVTAMGAALAGVVLATPGAGILSATVVARSGFLDPVDINFKTKDGRTEVVHVRDAQDTVIQQMVLAPGGRTGWHTHPGPAVVLVRSGTLSLYSLDTGCVPRIYSAGQAFVDSGQGHVHLAANLSTTENVELWVTFFDVPPGGAFRLDAANPGGGCPF